jgi:hypothetical protein
MIVTIARRDRRHRRALPIVGGSQPRRTRCAPEDLFHNPAKDALVAG